MNFFDSAGVRIAYDVLGNGAPVLLVHGFASNGRVNWAATGWVKRLIDADRRVIVFDNRGHGESEKLYDPARYYTAEMAEDARRLLDHLEITTCDVIGYSMGARITALLAIHHPSRVRRAVLGGMAANMTRGVLHAGLIADGLEAARQEDVTDPIARAFRLFGEQTRSDLRALAACMRAGRPEVPPDALARIACPALVVAGDADEIAGPVEPMVEMIPDARGLSLPGKDHMKAVGDKQFKAAAVEFLAG